MRTLALDIGTRRTGVAFLDDAVGVPLPLETLRHQTEDALIERVLALIVERGATRLVVGLPLLPDGTEGSQARLVRGIADRLRKAKLPIEFVDERYTTVKVRSAKAKRHSPPPSAYDGDAAAACALLLS